MKKMKGPEKDCTDFFAEIPLGVMFDILSRLPVKTLYKLKCISKTWRDDYLLVPYFLELHYRRSQQNSLVLLAALSKAPFQVKNEYNATLHLLSEDLEGHSINKFSAQIKVDCPSPSFSQDVIVLPSQRDLVCISTKDHIYICNPSTQEFAEVTEMGSSLLPAFPTDIGFGFVASTNEYKLVRLLRNTLADNDIKAGCEVLTIPANNSSLSKKAASWREIEEGCPNQVQFMKPAFVNGSLLVWHINRFCSERGDDHLLGFDLEEEKFLILPPPPFAKVRFWFGMREINGDLWVFDYATCDTTNTWALKIDKFKAKYEWSMEYSVDLSTMDGFHLNCFRCNFSHKALIQHLRPKINSKMEICLYTDSFFSIARTLKEASIPIRLISTSGKERSC